MNKIYFYQNNPCVIIREINDDFAEVALSHKFAQDMQLRWQCQGCCIGDSDNKISCTCDEFSWIIEEIQEEENKIICIVEKRLLVDQPIEKIVIDKLQKQIQEEKSRFDNTKDLHKEWTDHLNAKRTEAKAIDAKLSALKLENEALAKSISSTRSVLETMQSKFDDISVFVDKYSLRPLEIKNSEYQGLLERGRILSALESGGVDNWEWYSESISKLDHKND